MPVEKEPINKVSRKDILTLDLEIFIPKDTELAYLDLSKYLYKGLILKEKEFRVAMKELDWSQFENKYLCISCSTDAIIPLWAYMLPTSYANNLSKTVIYTNENNVYDWIVWKKIINLDVSPYENRRVIVKGCSSRKLKPEVYVAITSKLQPVVRSLQFGEACSMVPIYKK